MTVDGVADLLCQRKVFIVELQVNHSAGPKGGRQLALNGGAVADAPTGQLVNLYAAATGRSAGSADQHVALRQRVNLIIYPFQRRHQQSAATQALGVTHGGHHHVDILPGARKRRQLGGDHDRRHVFQLHVGARWHGDTQLRQHVAQALGGERGLHGLVTGTVQPHHQSVTDQRVIAYALHRDQIANALRRGRQAQRTNHQRH
ncbi:hypothetical protein D3C71_1342130 [compost metagenome]